MSDAFSTEQTDRSPEAALYDFEFTGSAGEFFRIWIVNVSLTVLTLGIYSAWAKVRTSRYFAANTHVAGASFDYLADPIAILKGRMIVLVFLGAYSMSSALSPLVQAPLGIVLLFAFPWAICRSLAFRAHNTAWRNIRFAFGGQYKDAATAYIALPILGVLSLGLAYPYAVYRQRQFMVDHAAFGTTRFDFGSRPGRFYALFGILSLIGIGGFVLITAALGGVATAAADSPDASWGQAFGFALILPLYFVLFAYYAAKIANLTYDGARLGAHELVSRIPVLPMGWIYLTNGIAIVASLGLLIPWSHVRLTRFRLAHMGLVARGSLDDFAAAQGDDVASLGAEFGDAFDFDLGL